MKTAHVDTKIRSQSVASDPILVDSTRLEYSSAPSKTLRIISYAAARAGRLQSWSYVVYAITFAYSPELILHFINVVKAIKIYEGINRADIMAVETGCRLLSTT